MGLNPEPDAKQIRFAIVGCGLIGGKRANALPKGSLVAVYDLVPERAAALAAKAGPSCIAATSLQQLLDTKTDAVIVSTLNANLGPVTLACLKAGKHVLAEKPVAISLQEIDELIACANDMQFVNLGQAQIITAVTSNNGDIAGVWAPNTYTLEDRANAKYLCSGADAGAVVPGALVVRADYAKEHPDEVSKYLAVYLRAWSWARANPAEARTLALDFYKQGGLEVTERAMEQEFTLRPTFLLDEQLKIMSRAGGASTVDGWFSEIGKFMTETGTIPSSPEPKDFISDEFLKRVDADPKLKAFANEFNKK